MPPEYRFDMRNADNIPMELKAERCWLMWVWLWNGKKWDKRPEGVEGSTRWGKDNPAAWGTFEEAWARWEMFPGHYAGLGIIIRREWIGLDIDLPVSHEFCQQAMRAAPRIYWEASPSGKLHGLTRGAFPGHGSHKTVVCGSSFEMYRHAPDKSQFMTITGNRIRSSE